MESSEELGIKNNMTPKTLLMAACLMIIVSCASNHGKPTTDSEWSTVPGSQFLSIDAKAQLKKVENEYKDFTVLAVEHNKIFIGSNGLMPKFVFNAIQDAVGKEFEVSIDVD
jgi:hypothetical protein